MWLEGPVQIPRNLMSHSLSRITMSILLLYCFDIAGFIQSRRKSVRRASSLTSDMCSLAPSLRALAGTVCEAKLLLLLLSRILRYRPLRDLIWADDHTTSGAHFFPSTACFTKADPDWEGS